MDATESKIEFIETPCKSVLNRVQGDSMPFRWTINPYRGCQHACTYCYARVTHTYFGLDAGHDFDRRIMVKVNAPAVLRRELGRAWNRELVAVGTATDPYQPAETNYGLTRQILELLAEFETPVTLTTKSPLVLRDIDVLERLARGPGVSINVSITTLDEALWASMEPGTAHPLKRFEAVGELRRRGITAGVFLAPLIPGLNDGVEQVEAILAEAARRRASFVSPSILRLGPSVREWYMEWAQRQYPGHARRLESLYARMYPPRPVADASLRRVRELRGKYDFTGKDEVLADGETDTGSLLRAALAKRERAESRAMPTPPRSQQLVFEV